MIGRRTVPATSGVTVVNSGAKARRVMGSANTVATHIVVEDNSVRLNEKGKNYAIISRMHEISGTW